MSESNRYQNLLPSPASPTAGIYQTLSHDASSVKKYPCLYPTFSEPHSSITTAQNSSYDDASDIRYTNFSTSATAFPSARLARRQTTQSRDSSFHIEEPDVDEEWGPDSDPQRRRFREGDRRFQLKERLWAALFGICILVICLVFWYFFTKRASEIRLAELEMQKLRLQYARP